jgi:hypothetical protein
MVKTTLMGRLIPTCLPVLKMYKKFLAFPLVIDKFGEKLFAPVVDIFDKKFKIKK